MAYKAVNGNVEVWSDYIIESHKTIRETAKYFGIGKSNLHEQLHKHYDGTEKGKVLQGIFDANITEGRKKGGRVINEIKRRQRESERQSS